MPRYRNIVFRSLRGTFVSFANVFLPFRRDGQYPLCDYQSSTSGAHWMSLCADSRCHYSYPSRVRLYIGGLA